MNRRSFLSALIPAAIVLTDPEELIWKPIKKIFILPAPKRFIGMDWGRDVGTFITGCAKIGDRIAFYGVDGVFEITGEAHERISFRPSSEFASDAAFIDGLQWPSLHNR